MSDAAALAILTARARALARPITIDDASDTQDAFDILVFNVGDERLAIPLESIVAIVRAASITPLPRAVAPVYGVTAWRGRPLTVLSAGGNPASRDASCRLIVLGDDRRATIGVLAESVDDATVVRRSTLVPARDGRRGVPTMGMTTDAVLVLDAESLLNAARPQP